MICCTLSSHLEKKKGYKISGLGGREGLLKSNIMVRERLTTTKKYANVGSGKQKWVSGTWGTQMRKPLILTEEGKKVSQGYNVTCLRTRNLASR